MDRRDLLKTLALLPLAGLPSEPEPEQQSVHLSGCGGWLERVDVRETLMRTLQQCEPLGIVSGVFRVTVAGKTFESDLPLTANRMACDVVSTRWLWTREYLKEDGQAPHIEQMDVHIKVKTLIRGPKWPEIRFVRYGSVSA